MERTQSNISNYPPVFNPDLMSGKQVRQNQPAPAEPAVDGAKLLDDINAAGEKFFWQKDWEHWIETLWVVYTHGYHNWDCAPILGIHSPVPGCGKTDKLRFLSALVRNGCLEVGPTGATLYREIEQDHPTLLLDEMDKAYWPDVQKIINSGFTRGVTVPRCVGEDNVVKHFSPFGPKALATMGKELPSDTGDRALMVRMRKKPANEKRAKFKTVKHEPELSNLREKAETWARQNRQALIDSDPSMPEIVYNRSADQWLPLLAVADLAGGEWPKRARKAAVEHERRKGYGDRKLTMLANIRELQETWSKDQQLTPKALAEALCEREDWQWGASDKPLTGNQLGQAMKTLGVEAVKDWVPELKKQQRLFTWERFEDAAKEYGVGRGVDN